MEAGLTPLWGHPHEPVPSDGGRPLPTCPHCSPFLPPRLPELENRAKGGAERKAKDGEEEGGPVAAVLLEHNPLARQARLSGRTQRASKCIRDMQPMDLSFLLPAGPRWFFSFKEAVNET